MQVKLHVLDEKDQQEKLLDWNEDVPEITIHSHIHPLHVIMNAYPKFKAWHPTPVDTATLEIINDICTIWDLLKSVPPTEAYLQYPHVAKADHTSLGVPSGTSSRTTRSRSRGSHSDGSSLGKRSEREDDDGGTNGSGSRRRCEGNSRAQHPTEEVIPELEDSLSSHESSADSFITDWADYIRDWQNGVVHGMHGAQGGAGSSVDEHDRADIGSPKVKGYKGWKPVWDRRRVDTKSFSSNDWAFYYNTCDLTGDYPLIRFS
jgi:hypothetical protein